MFTKYVVRIIFSEISQETYAIVSKKSFPLTLLIILSTLTFHFGLKEVNEETASVLLTRWIEGTGGVHLSVMTQTSFFFRFPCLSDLLSLFDSFRRFSKAGSRVKMTLSNFKPREKSILFFFVYILDRISPRRNCCEIMEQRGKSEPLTPIPPKGFLFSEHC